MGHKMKRLLSIGLVLLLISVSSLTCKKEEEKKVALKEEEKEFFKEELPALDEWAKKKWAEKEWSKEEEIVELETPKGLQEAMASTSMNMRRLSRGVEKKDWEAVVESATKIEDLIAGRCVNLYYKEHPEGVPTDFVLIGDKFRISIRSLVLAGKARNISSVQSNFDKVQQTCKDCHNIYKKEQ